MFHVSTREAAEVEMKKQDYTWKWLDDGSCEITSMCLDAVKVSSNGNKVFYN